MDKFTVDFDLKTLNILLFSESYQRACENIRRLDQLYDDDPLYLEAVTDYNKSVKSEWNKIAKNTSDTIRDTAHGYRNVTDVGGGILKAGWDIAMKGASIAFKLFKVIYNGFVNLPIYGRKIKEKVTKIPKALLTKIRGDIKLYINPQDISEIYNSHLFQTLTQYVAKASKASEGDCWGRWNTFILFGDNKRKDSSGKKINDLLLFNQMHELYNEFRRVEFSQQIIKMKDEATAAIYFGDIESVKFVDSVNNVSFMGTYYDGLLKLLDDMTHMKDELKQVENMLNIKTSETRKNLNIADLRKDEYKALTQAINETAKTVSLLAKIITYVQSDLKEIEIAVDKIINSGNLSKLHADTINAVKNNGNP